METKKKPNYYTGAGYRLGSEDEPSSVSRPVTTATPAQEELEPVKSCKLSFVSYLSLFIGYSSFNFLA